MNLQEIIQMDKDYFVNVFGDRTPVCFTHGKGMNLWDLDGKRYYDFFAGLAVTVLGHSHPDFVDGLKSQLDKLIHTSSVYYVENQAKLAKALAENSCADKFFFSNSGGEANEGAIKLARIYYNKKGLGHKYEIICLNNSFHGRTLATLAATGQEKYQKSYRPLTPRFVHVDINDIDALKKVVNPDTCAIMLEPVQGESGVHPLTKQYLNDVAQICRDNDSLLILDEVQTGMGRTGKMFGYMHTDIEPDIFTLAKGLGGGIPIGAVCAKNRVAEAFSPGDHGSTFGGNPFACAAGLLVIDIMQKENLVENSYFCGQYLQKRLLELKDRYPFIKELRGMGLMQGIEFSKPCSREITADLLKQGFLAGSVGDFILRLLPPLIISKQNIDMFIDCLDVVLKSKLGG